MSLFNLDERIFYLPMNTPFYFDFIINGRKFKAEAYADLSYNRIFYHIKTGDLVFRVFPTKATDGSVRWVDDNGDTFSLLQTAGNAIIAHELGFKQ